VDRTIRATTQLAICQAIHPIQCRFHTEVLQLKYPRIGGQHGKFHPDNFYAQVPSLSMCTMGQMYTNDIGFVKFIPMQHISDAPNTLVKFMQDVGISAEFHSYDSKELT
jgi:hypothetical protein